MIVMTAAIAVVGVLVCWSMTTSLRDKGSHPEREGEQVRTKSAPGSWATPAGLLCLTLAGSVILGDYILAEAAERDGVAYASPLWLDTAGRAFAYGAMIFGALGLFADGRRS